MANISLGVWNMEWLNDLFTTGTVRQRSSPTVPRCAGHAAATPWANVGPRWPAS